MEVLRPLLAAAALCVTLNVKADYLFTWHYIYPQFQKFQGSFELTDAEMQPGVVFGSDLFRNSVSITSPEGILYHASDPNWSDVGGHFDPQHSDPPFGLYINTHDDSHAISLGAVAVGTPDLSGVNPLTGSIYEFFPDGTIVQEHGWWSIQQIPEPSAGAILLFGGLIWLAKSRKRRLPA